MKRDRQHRVRALAQSRHLRDDPGGRDRDASAREREALAVAHHVDRIDHVVEIIERLAHSHEHDVGHEPAAIGRIAVSRSPSVGKVSEPVARDDELGGDLGRGQVADEALRPVWQKEQVSVQPTWLETHSVPRSSSGM
jgi:hypothetical protein